MIRANYLVPGRHLETILNKCKSSEHLPSKYYVWDLETVQYRGESYYNNYIVHYLCSCMLTIAYVLKLLNTKLGCYRIEV